MCAALAACAGQPRWEKPGADTVAAWNDSEQCHAQARLAPTSPLLPVTASSPDPVPIVTREEQLARLQVQQFQKCMRDKGYTAKR